MAQRTNVEDIITDECISAIKQGVTRWSQIREMIKQRLASLPDDERLIAERRLSLMVDREQDRPHETVRH